MPAPSAYEPRLSEIRVLVDPDADRPIYAALSAAKVNSLPSGIDPGDITAAQPMPIAPGATYVFDLGYCDYAW